jgi:hypothetical protein
MMTEVYIPQNKTQQSFKCSNAFLDNVTQTDILHSKKYIDAKHHIYLAGRRPSKMLLV